MKNRPLFLFILCSLGIAAAPPQQLKRAPSMSSDGSSSRSVKALDFGTEVWLRGTTSTLPPYDKESAVFVDEEAFQEYLDHSVTDQRVKRWSVEKKVFLAPDQTKAVVQETKELDFRGDKIQVVNVRIKEGRFRNKRGWVFASNMEVIR